MFPPNGSVLTNFHSANRSELGIASILPSEASIAETTQRARSPDR
jgi:hypothetical protein